MHRIAAFLVALALTATAVGASAQVYVDEDGGDEAQGLYITSTTTTTTAVGVAFVFATIASILPDKNASAVELYLRNNAVAVRSDVPLGAGDTVDDLAMLLAVPDAERARFGRALRLASSELVELAQPDQLDTERARRFVAVARNTWLLLKIREARAT